MSRSRQSSPLAERRTLQKGSDTRGLRQLYLRDGEELARASGMDPSRLLQLAERSDSEVQRGSAKVLDLARHRARQQKVDDGLRRATRAAREIQRAARWQDGNVHLDVTEVLGDLLAAPSKYFCFSVEEEQVLVERGRLARLRPLARRLDGLSVHLTERALCFRWRGGRGGLDLFTRPLRARAPEDVFHVPLVRHRKMQRAPLPLGRFITQVMNELEHFPTP